MPHKCIYCNDDRIFDTFMGLRSHVIKSHNNGYCVICKREYKNLRYHIYRKAREGDQEHMVYYGLIVKRTWEGDGFKKKCTALAEKRTEVVISTII